MIRSLNINKSTGLDGIRHVWMKVLKISASIIDSYLTGAIINNDLSRYSFSEKKPQKQRQLDQYTKKKVEIIK